jgi:hypothetical protein
MSAALWIALGAVVLVIAAHVLLFWLFLGRSGGRRDDDPGEDPPR